MTGGSDPALASANLKRTKRVGPSRCFDFRVQSNINKIRFSAFKFFSIEWFLLKNINIKYLENFTDELMLFR